MSAAPLAVVVSLVIFAVEFLCIHILYARQFCMVIYHRIHSLHTHQSIWQVSDHIQQMRSANRI